MKERGERQKRKWEEISVTAKYTPEKFHLGNKGAIQ